MIFQDPYGSLDPRQRVGSHRRRAARRLERVSRDATRARVAEALEAVGLNARDAAKYPHEFSGGQRQRIAIARALITRPKLVVADEPVSALDVSIQAQVLNLMSDLQRDAGVTFLLISHDLGVVGHICDDDGGDVSRPLRRNRPLRRGFRHARASLRARTRRRRRRASTARRGRPPRPCRKRAARRSADAPMPRAAPSRARAASPRTHLCFPSARREASAGPPVIIPLFRSACLTESPSELFACPVLRRSARDPIS